MPREVPNQEVVWAVVHWLEFEHYCGRDQLFCESSLRQPIGLVLQKGGWVLEVEQPYNQVSLGGAGRGRPKAADFCIKRPGRSNAWQDIVETKFVTGKRAYAQEILQDLLRLEGARSEQNEAFDRWLLVAGWKEQLARLRRESVGDTRIDQILPFPNAEEGKRIVTLQTDEKIDDCWVNAARAQGLRSLPRRFYVRRDAYAESQHFACYMWLVQSTRRRTLTDVELPPTPPAQS